jgi:sugar phosphate isomerase/epimerase
MTMIERRTLLGAAAGTAAIALSGAVGAATTRRLERFGLQLYTLREAAKADPIGTLRRIKALGYSEVELGGPPYSTMDPRVLRRELVRIGLTAPSMHVPIGALETDAAKIFAQAATLGCRYVVVPYLDQDRRSTIAQCQVTAAALNGFGAAAKTAGLSFAYHNHSFEFVPVEGKLPFDIFFGESDPALVKIELDLHWAVKAKADVGRIFAQYPGRIALCHVKDMTADGRMVAVGAGVIDFAAIFAKSRQAGLVHYFVEHDEPPAPYWPTVAAGADHLKTLRFLNQ